MKTTLILYFIPCLILTYFFFIKFDYNSYTASKPTHILGLFMSFVSIIFLLSKKCITTDYKSLFILGFLYSLFGFHLFYQMQLDKII